MSAHAFFTLLSAAASNARSRATRAEEELQRSSVRLEQRSFHDLGLAYQMPHSFSQDLHLGRLCFRIFVSSTLRSFQQSS